MLKKILISILFLIVFSIGCSTYNHRMNALVREEYKMLETREESGSLGNKFVYGSYEGQEVVFEAIRNNVNGGLLAMSPDEFVRLGICNLSNCDTTNELSYADTTLYYVETEINNSLNSSQLAGTLNSVFIPSYDEIRDGGTFGLNAALRKMVNVLNYDKIPSFNFEWNGL